MLENNIKYSFIGKDDKIIIDISNMTSVLNRIYRVLIAFSCLQFQWKTIKIDQKFIFSKTNTSTLEDKMHSSTWKLNMIFMKNF